MSQISNGVPVVVARRTTVIAIVFLLPMLVGGTMYGLDRLLVSMAPTVTHQIVGGESCYRAETWINGFRVRQTPCHKSASAAFAEGESVRVGPVPVKVEVR